MTRLLASAVQDKYLAEAVRRGDRLRGVDFVLVPEDEDEPLEADEKALAEEQAVVIRALLWEASTGIMVELFDDYDRIACGEDAALTMVIGELPSAFVGDYDVSFARKFVITMAEVTLRFSSGWEQLPTTAHELALSLVIARAEELGTQYQSVLPSDWGSYLVDCLVEDTDFEGLYSEAIGTPASHASAWFVPFNVRATYRTAPFVENEA